MLLATAETVRPGPGPVPGATAEETERILAWLERPETRLVETSGRLGVTGPWRGALHATCSRKAEAAGVARRDSSVRS